MKLPFFYKSNSSSSSSNISSSCSSSSSSPWPWPSCHQNPKTLSFRKSVTYQNPTSVDKLELPPANLCSSSSSSAADAIAGPSESNSIENVIKGLRSSKRLIFEQKGKSKFIAEEANRPRNGFMLLSLESNDPYSDFKRSMEEMVEAHALQEWKSLEKLLYWFLKVNRKSSHGYILAAFVDLLVGLALHQNDVVSSSSTTVTGEITSASISCSNNEMNKNVGESPASPLSFYTSCSSDSSSSDETLFSVPHVSGGSRVYCSSSLVEMKENIKDIDMDGYVSC